ncbi:MAG: hypothetical protein ACRBFS_21720 [Aureispira sp.]
MKKTKLEAIGRFIQVVVPIVISVVKKEVEERKQKYLDKLRDNYHKQLKKEAFLLFNKNDDGQLTEIEFRSSPHGGVTFWTLPIRCEDPTPPVLLTKKQIKKLDGLYKCWKNETLSDSKITQKIYVTLLELDEHQEGLLQRLYPQE